MKTFDQRPEAGAGARQGDRKGTASSAGSPIASLPVPILPLSPH